MSGFRKAIVAAVLACCSHTVAVEPASPPRLGNLLESGWGLPSDAEESAIAGDSVSPAPVAHSVPPVMLGPVVQAPLLQEPFVPAVPSVGQQVPNVSRKIFVESQDTRRVHTQSDFEALQIERAPSVPRLQPRRVVASGPDRENFSVDSQARVVAADPINAVGFPLTESSRPNVEVEETQPAEICDLVDVDSSESSRPLVDERQILPAEIDGMASREGVDNGNEFSELNAVALLFKELQGGDARDNVETLQLPPDANTEAGETQLMAAGVNNRIHAIASESAGAMTDPWGLIESANHEPVDPLRRAAELWELTQQTLLRARQAVEDENVVAAKNLALETFRLCVSALDAAEQTDSSTVAFQAALDAARESSDFCLPVDNMDQQQIQQVILNHKTAVLSSQNLGELSGHDAAFRYMTFARCSLVKAAKGIPEAGEALMLLGAAEFEGINGNTYHRDAIAVMLQRAAIEICPTDYEPHLALGITLSKQGLRKQACLSIQRSIEIRPTLRGYQELISFAKQAGDEAVLEELYAQLQLIAPGADPTTVALRVAAKGNRDSQVKVQGAESDIEPDVKVNPRLGWRTLLPFIR